jgi:hypothetical protein
MVVLRQAERRLRLYYVNAVDVMSRIHYWQVVNGIDKPGAF